MYDYKGASTLFFQRRFLTYSWLSRLSHLQTLTLAWQLWTAAWRQPRPAMWTIFARSSALNMSRLALNRRPSQASATGGNATRLCADSSTASLLTTRTSCSSVLARTQRAQSVGGRPLYPVAPMKAQKSPAASHRWGSAMLTTCAGSTAGMEFIPIYFNVRVMSGVDIKAIYHAATVWYII